MKTNTEQENAKSAFFISVTTEEKMDNNFAEQLERKTVDEIRSVLIDAQPFVLFSGGKDSSVSLKLVQQAAKSLGREVIAIHAETTAGTPDNLKYVRAFCRLLNVQLIVVRPKDDYFELVLRKGFPRFNARWCCMELKVKPIRDFIRKQKEEKIIFDGVRAEESRQRSVMPQISWHKQFQCLVYHPILHWKKEDVFAFIKRHNLPLNPLYLKGFKRASECWCGVFKSVEEFRLLRSVYPDFFEKLVEVEAAMRKGGSYLFQNGKKIYLKDLK